jgi:hypothetical protein
MRMKNRLRAAQTGVLILMLGLCAARAFGQEEGQKPSSEQSKNQSQAPVPAQGGEQDATKKQSGEQTQEEITAVPNRPTFATTAETVQRGVFEIEYGFEGGDGHENINGLLKWGMVKNVELWFLNNPIERDSGLAGVGDSGAGFKYKIFSQAKTRPTFSVLYIAKLPTARVELGAGAVGHSAQILLSKDFGKHHFDFNEGAQFVGRPGEKGFDRNYFTALSYSRQFTAKWGWTAELAGYSWTNAAAPATMTLLAAPTYTVSPRLVLDGGAYVAVYGNLPRVTCFLGVTYSVSDLYHLHASRKLAKN